MIVGYGHIIRCLALAENLKNFFKIVFLTTNSKENLNSIIRKNKYNLIQLKKTSKTLPNVKSKFDADQIIKIINKIGNKKSLLLVDNYNLSYKWESMIKPFVNKVIVIDDLITRKHNCDLIIDQNLHTNMKKLYVDSIPKKLYKIIWSKLCYSKKTIFTRKKVC